MRNTALVMTFLFLVACLCAAGDDPPATIKATSAAPATAAAESPSGPPLSMPDAPLAATKVLQSPDGYKLSRAVDKRDSVCFTMRSYVVARESPNSDSTRLVAYKTCQPGWKFELRNAVGTVDDSPR